MRVESELENDMEVGELDSNLECKVQLTGLEQAGSLHLQEQVPGDFHLLSLSPSL